MLLSILFCIQFSIELSLNHLMFISLSLSLLRTQLPVSRDAGPGDIRQTLHMTDTTHILHPKYTETTDASK